MEGPLFFEEILKMVAPKWRGLCREMKKEDLLEELKRGEEVNILFWKRGKVICFAENKINGIEASN